MLDLERAHGKLFTTVCVTEAKVEGLVQTIRSRFDAFDKGQEIILLRLKHLDEIRNKAAGAVWLASALGITAIVGGIVAIVRMIRG